MLGAIQRTIKLPCNIADVPIFSHDFKLSKFCSNDMILVVAVPRYHGLVHLPGCDLRATSCRGDPNCDYRWLSSEEENTMNYDGFMVQDGAPQ